MHSIAVHARRFARHKGGMIGAAILLAFLLVAVFAPVLAPFDPELGDLAVSRQPPNAEHWMGTDNLGRDILSRIIYGTRISMQVGLIAVGIGLAFGVPLGAVSGYMGGRVDLVLQRGIDVMMAFPGLLLAIVVVSVLGFGLENAMIALGVVSIPQFVRLVRAAVITLKSEVFIEAARAIGCRPGHILLRHILPNVLSPIIVFATLRFAQTLLFAAALGFVGLGAQPPTPEWGAMLADGRKFLRTLPHMAVFPGLAITLAVLGLNLVGDALRDLLDPRLRRTL